MVELPNFPEVAMSTLSAMAVGSSGIFPALILDAPNKLSSNEIGSLLGEVFLHLLPESVNDLLSDKIVWAFAILFGILVCFAIEMIAGFYENVQCGLIATSCLLIHEIPHEISDFIILLRSGFSRWDAIKAQLLTASTCPIGTYALILLRWRFKDWMVLLPFTAGGFLYIALVSLLPTFLQEEIPRESLIQLCFMVLGVACIQGIACVHFFN